MAIYNSDSISRAAQVQGQREAEEEAKDDAAFGNIVGAVVAIGATALLGPAGAGLSAGLAGTLGSTAGMIAGTAAADGNADPAQLGMYTSLGSTAVSTVGTYYENKAMAQQVYDQAVVHEVPGYIKGGTPSFRQIMEPQSMTQDLLTTMNAKVAVAEANKLALELQRQKQIINELTLTFGLGGAMSGGTFVTVSEDTPLDAKIWQDSGLSSSQAWSR